MDNFELAAQFSSDTAAHMAQGMLQSNGIESHIESDSMATLYGAGMTWAPIRLFVKAPELERALELLREHGDI